MRRLGLLLLLIACRKPDLSGVSGELRAGATTLAFGDTWVNAKVQRPLMLSNTSLAAIDLTFTVDAPFVAPAALHLEGGASATVQPGFSPVAVGAASATLGVRSASAAVSVLLEGNGVAQPPCDPSACRSAELDPATGICFQTPKPDGTGCSDMCLSDAVCQHGDCVGTQHACDDGDPCTTDACASDTGCVHVPVVCPSDDACSAPTCEAGVGCMPHPAVDGTSCGAADCTTAHVCIAGQCVTRAVPDGTACGPASICQTAGRCQGQQCVQDPAVMITRLWMYQGTAFTHLGALVGDDENNLFTVACMGAGTFTEQCELLSLDPAGLERWHTVFPHTTDTGDGALRDALMLAGSHVVSTVGPDWVDVFDATSGKHEWSLDLKTLGLFPAGNYPAVRPISVGFDGTQLVLVLEGSNGGSISGDAVITLDPATGTLGTTVPLPSQAFAVVIDKAGRSYLSHASIFNGTVSVFEDAVTAFDPAFGVRWQKTLGEVGDYVRQMLATRGGSILLAAYDHSELLSTQNGAVETAGLGAYWFSGSPVWGDATIFSHHQYCAMASCSGFSEYTIDLEIVDNATLGLHAARLSPFDWASGSWLTEHGTALVALQPDVLGAKPELREVDPQGRLLMQCPLQLSMQAIIAGPVLGAGRYAAVTGDPDSSGGEHIEVWALPGYEPAASGWVSPRGGRGLDLREQ